MNNLQLEILYEDEDVLVINKPAGLVVHPDGRTKEPSVSEWFAEKYPESKGVGEKMGEIARPGIVHRLDRETSGALLLAKTQKGHAHLKKQFQDREVEKIYHLFVYGNVKDDFGTINLPIGRSKTDFRKRVAVRLAQGKQAITYFKVMGRDKTHNVSFIAAQPKTGRTHQIRAHFQALHHPVVGDKLYAKGKPALLGFERLALHARKITFKNTKGDKVTIEAPYPEDFQRALENIK